MAMGRLRAGDAKVFHSLSTHTNKTCLLCLYTKNAGSASVRMQAARGFGH